MSDKHEQVAREISRYWSPRRSVERSELDEQEAIRLALAQLQPILERAFPEPVDPASLTPERVCEVLNAVQHRGRDNWEWNVEGDCLLGGPYLEADIDLEDTKIIAAYYLQGRISES